MSELKPCPFCGNKHLSVVKHDSKYGWRPFYYVLCDYGEGGCGSSGQWNHEESDAIEAWTRRANDGTD